MCWVAPIDDGCYMLVCTTVVSSDLERSASSRIEFLHLEIFCSVLRLLKRTDQLFEVILHEKKTSSNVNKVID